MNDFAEPPEPEFPPYPRYAAPPSSASFRPPADAPLSPAASDNAFLSHLVDSQSSAGCIRDAYEEFQSGPPVNVAAEIDRPAPAVAELCAQFDSILHDASRTPRSEIDFINDLYEKNRREDLASFVRKYAAVPAPTKSAVKTYVDAVLSTVEEPVRLRLDRDSAHASALARDAAASRDRVAVLADAHAVVASAFGTAEPAVLRARIADYAATGRGATPAPQTPAVRMPQDSPSRVSPRRPFVRPSDEASSRERADVLSNARAVVAKAFASTDPSVLRSRMIEYAATHRLSPTADCEWLFASLAAPPAPERTSEPQTPVARKRRPSPPETASQRSLRPRFPHPIS